jgi:hypothetical protein
MYVPLGKRLTDQISRHESSPFFRRPKSWVLRFVQVSNKNHRGGGIRCGEVYILPDSDFGFSDNHGISHELMP